MIDSVVTTSNVRINVLPFIMFISVLDNPVSVAKLSAAPLLPFSPRGEEFEHDTILLTHVVIVNYYAARSVWKMRISLKLQAQQSVAVVWAVCVLCVVFHASSHNIKSNWMSERGFDNLLDAP